jgi:hypothetical protein
MWHGMEERLDGLLRLLLDQCRSRRSDTRARKVLENLFNLCVPAGERLPPECVSRILDEFDESNEQAPLIRAKEGWRVIENIDKMERNLQGEDGARRGALRARG